MATPNDRDDRLSNRGQSDSKQGREATDRPATENRVANDQSRLDAFRNSFFSSALPDLPPIPGYHVCWLTTTNPRDPIHARVRLGYEPIKATEIQGWDHAALKGGDWSGYIGVNEMVAFKLPIHLYQMYMNEAHHVQPNEEEGKLRSVLEVIANEAKSKGADVEVGDGSAELGRGPRVGKFEGVDA
jgi:hypothetical protein